MHLSQQGKLITGRELKTGRELLAEYIFDSGGDPDFTMEKLGCPKGYPPCSHVRVQPRQLTKKVISSPFGWQNNANGKCRKVRLLCCWNDSTQSSCIHPSCPYTHLPTNVNNHDNDDPFAHVPCCSAGMNGGCRWHAERLLEASRWTVPKLELANMDYDIGESLRRPRVHGSECSQGETILCTFHLGDRIVIQEEWCQQIQVHVERYLFGHAMLDDD